MEQDALENKQGQAILRELQSKARRGGMKLGGEYILKAIEFSLEFILWVIE